MGAGHSSRVSGAPAPETAPDDFKWELYHVAEDFPEANDVSAQNPNKLKELHAVFDEEAKKYHVYPLDATFAERADVSIRPSLELLAYLRANRFKTFIVSGGGIEFMRAFAEKDDWHTIFPK